MVANFMKGIRLSYQKIYRKSQISFSLSFFNQNFTKNHEIFQAEFETRGPFVVLLSSKMLAYDVFCA
jgi:hypothetical protein